MKIITIIMIALFSLPSFSGVLKKSVSQSVLNKLNVGNGSAYIQTYSPSEFTLEKRLNTIKQWNSESGCNSWTTESDLKSTITKLKENGAGELSKILENLRLSNSLKAGIFNNSLPSEDSENCSFFYYEIYSNDGEVLILDLDFNH